MVVSQEEGSMSWGGYIPGSLLRQIELVARVKATYDTNDIVQNEETEMDSNPNTEELTEELIDRWMLADAARRNAVNALADYKRLVGQNLSDLVLEYELLDMNGDMAGESLNMSDALVELFGTIGINDFLPVKEWLVEVTATVTTWINIEAPNREDALAKVQGSSFNPDLERELRNGNLEIYTWKTTGQVDPN